MYQLDKDAAIQADNKSSALDRTGKYIGVFTRAENITSPKGTQGVEFAFNADTGEKAGFLTIWTINNKGEKLFGYKTLMAIMTCLSVRNINKVQATVQKYDFDTNENKAVQAEIFPDLMNKKIGLLIQMEEYQKISGELKWKPNIFAPFRIDDFTASEILTNAPKPEKLEMLIEHLKDKPLRGGGQAANNQKEKLPGGQYGGGMQGDEYFDDDIPF